MTVHKSFNSSIFIDPKKILETTPNHTESVILEPIQGMVKGRSHSKNKTDMYFGKRIYFFTYKPRKIIENYKVFP